MDKNIVRKYMLKNIVFLIIFILLFFCIGHATNKSTGDSIPSSDCCLQDDVVDLFFRGHNPFGSKEDKRFRFVWVPIIAYDPATDLQLGGGGSFSLQLGNPASTRISAGMASFLFTTKNQFFIQWKSNVYFPENNWLLQSVWRYYIFTLPVYTLGTNSQSQFPDVPGFSDVIIDPGLNGRYQMDYNWLKFHNILSRKITKNINCGIGYLFDYFFDIDDHSFRITNDTLYNTPHYSFSTLHGFNPVHYFSSGLSANFVFDSRDNMLHAYKGIFVNINYRYNFTWLGSSRN